MVKPSINVPISLLGNNISNILKIKIGVGPHKVKLIQQPINHIKSFDDLVKLKIGIGIRTGHRLKMTVEKLKRYYYLNKSSKPTVINKFVNEKILPMNEPPLVHFTKPLVMRH
jgi:hypothetical protein